MNSPLFTWWILEILYAILILLIIFIVRFLLLLT